MTADFDPELELRDIDQKKYPEFPDGFYISRRGLQLHLWEDTETAKEYALTINGLQGSLRHAQNKAIEAIAEAARNEWWARYAPIIIVGVTSIFTVAGVVIGYVAGRYLTVGR
jgi:hypothetical protein